MLIGNSPSVTVRAAEAILNHSAKAMETEASGEQLIQAERY